MTNAELQALLKELPDDLPVFCDNKYTETVDAFLIEKIKIVEEIHHLYTVGFEGKGKAIILTDD